VKKRAKKQRKAGQPPGPSRAGGDAAAPTPREPYGLRDLAVAAALLIAIALAYWPVAGHKFLNYDDSSYVTENVYVSNGLSWRGVGWAFTSLWQSNWHPLTWLSHMADWQCFGGWAGGHHLTSVAIHAINAVLLYLVLRRMTRAAWSSAMVAALFALHPLHVESVAWVAERKDVLSTMFGLLAWGAYLRYTERPSAKRYLLIVVCYVLALLAKPMLVTLPLVFLLLDYWPLGRFSEVGGQRSEVRDRTDPPISDLRSPTSDLRPLLIARQLVIEKIPLLALSAVSCAMTIVAQSRGVAMAPITYLPLSARVGNALAAYCGYLQKTLVPRGLAVFYPHPGQLPPWIPLAAGAGLLTATAVLLWASRRRPYLAVGWLWYLGTLVPVIGLVQVGQQAMADRYFYLPSVGLFIAGVWLAADVAVRRVRPTWLAALPAVAVLAGCTVLTAGQVRYWATSETLFQHALAVTDGNYVAHNSLGLALLSRAEIGAAKLHFHEALRIKPDYWDAYGNLGTALLKEREYDKARQQYLILLKASPHDVLVRTKLGETFLLQKRFQEAEGCFHEATELDPDNAGAWFQLAITQQLLGRTEAALESFGRSLQLKANNPMALKIVAWIRATHPEARFRNGNQALTLAREALRLRPGDPRLLDTLAAAYAEAGQYGEALATARQALAAAGKDVPAADFAAMRKRAALYEQGRPYRDPDLAGPPAGRK
jgi:Flp pilus assembly protein TadD